MTFPVSSRQCILVCPSQNWIRFSLLCYFCCCYRYILTAIHIVQFLVRVYDIHFLCSRNSISASLFSSPAIYARLYSYALKISAHLCSLATANAGIPCLGPKFLTKGLFVICRQCKSLANEELVEMTNAKSYCQCFTLYLGVALFC